MTKKDDLNPDAEQIRRLMDEGKTREADELAAELAELEEAAELGAALAAGGGADPAQPEPTAAELAAKVDAGPMLACDYCGQDMSEPMDLYFNARGLDLVAIDAKNKIRCTVCQAGDNPGPRYTATRKPSKKRAR